MDTEQTEPNNSPELDVPIPAHGERVVPWKARGRAKTREERGLSEITVSLPPTIGYLEVLLAPAIVAESDQAVAAIAKLDDVHGEHLIPLAGLLLRTESVASSKIEEVEASTKDFALATHGTKSNASAVSMVASTKALTSLITSVNGGTPITLDNILLAHRTLMEHDPAEYHYQGKLREEQNWIEGSDHTPLGATFVPPPHATVPAYIEDLLEFANRDDVPVLAQAAIAHAQFESIHPFTDGNGRIGRALINTILRRRGITSTVVVPLATALVAKRMEYFSLLAAYREGDAGPIIRAFCKAAETAATESRKTAYELARMPEKWMQEYETENGRRPRKGSTAQRILEMLPATPFFTAEEIEDTIRVSTSSVYAAIAKLHTAGIILPLNNKKRDRVWAASAVIEELDHLSARVAQQTRADLFWPTLSSQTATLILKLQQDRAKYVQTIWSKIMDRDAAKMAENFTHRMQIATNYRPAIHIPEFVINQLSTLDVSKKMQDALRVYSRPELIDGLLAANDASFESLNQSFAKLAEFGDASIRLTPVPKAVQKALDSSPIEADEPAQDSLAGTEGQTEPTV